MIVDSSYFIARLRVIPWREKRLVPHFLTVKTKTCYDVLYQRLTAYVIVVLRLLLSHAIIHVRKVKDTSSIDASERKLS